jgi:hypothetical protein
MSDNAAKQTAVVLMTGMVTRNQRDLSAVYRAGATDGTYRWTVYADPIFNFPIFPQARPKEVTHNDALDKIDAALTASSTSPSRGR